jgi:hypothetical protein
VFDGECSGLRLDHQPRFGQLSRGGAQAEVFEPEQPDAAASGVGAYERPAAGLDIDQAALDEGPQRAGDGAVLLIGHGGLFLSLLPGLLTEIDPSVARQRGLGHARCIVAESRATGLVCIDWPG